jgi:hypothetical protein
MITASVFTPLHLSVKDQKTWTFSALFVIGNLLLPQLCHLVPQGGMIFLPIYFFTLIAAYKFGITAGLLTAVISPLANHLLFGMPPSAMLPVILIKSGLLAVLAALIAEKSKSISLILIALVVLGYQVLGSAAESLIFNDINAGLQDFTLGYPGMLIQVFGGWALLKALARYGR